MASDGPVIIPAVRAGGLIQNSTKLFPIILLLSAAIVLNRQADAQELVQDGGFESLDTGDRAVGPLGDGWGVSMGQTSVIGPGNIYDVPQHSGVRSMDLDLGLDQNQLVQTIATTPGQQYLVSFWLAGDTSNPVTATFDGQTLLNGMGPGSGVGGVFSDWVYYEYTLEATSGSAQISFTSQYTFQGPGIGEVLDDVSVQPVPEPSTTIGAIGLGAMALRARRRR